VEAGGGGADRRGANRTASAAPRFAQGGPHAASRVGASPRPL